MPFHDAHDAELHLHTLLHRGQWSQALSTIDDWLERDPWRTELLLRKASIFRAMERYEPGLAAVRAYRAQKGAAAEAVFVEIEFLLDLQRTHEALAVLNGLPMELRGTPQADFHRGRALLAQREVTAGLHALWRAAERAPEWHRALVAWALAARRWYGARWVRRHLDAYLTAHQADPAAAIGVGLALNAVDARRGVSVLRRAVDRYPRRAPVSLPRTALPDGDTDTSVGREAYRLATGHILSGDFDHALQVYYRTIREDPVWMPVLAPLLAEILVDELLRPEEARILLEDALRRDACDYRLHLSHAKVFLQLGFGDEALSSANCVLALAPESERPVALVLRAGAYALLKNRDRAMQDLTNAVARLPEVRGLVRSELSLRPLARDPRFRAICEAPQPRRPWWQSAWRWLVGD